MHEPTAPAWNLDLNMDDGVDVDECHSFIWMKMNGCMVQLMDEIYLFGMNPTRIGIEIFTSTFVRGFQ
jgi:hypothetical protein